MYTQLCGSYPPTHLVDGESYAELLHSHLLLLSSVLLHECDEAGALAISIVVFKKVNDVLRVVGEGGKVTTSPGRLLQPAATLDHSIPTLYCTDRSA